VVVMNAAIFLDTAPCSLYVSQCFCGTYHLHLRGKNQPNKKPACSRWLGRISRQPRYQLCRVWRVRGSGLHLLSLAHLRVSSSPGKPMGSKSLVGVCEGQSGKTDVCERPVECKRTNL
jgi:hypothetical protein